MSFWWIVITQVIHDTTLTVCFLMTLRHRLPPPHRLGHTGPIYPSWEDTWGPEESGILICWWGTGLIECVRRQSIKDASGMHSLHQHVPEKDQWVAVIFLWAWKALIWQWSREILWNFQGKTCVSWKITQIDWLILLHIIHIFPEALYLWICEPEDVYKITGFFLKQISDMMLNYLVNYGELPMWPLLSDWPQITVWSFFLSYFFPRF